MTEGLTRLVPTLAFVELLAASMAMLARAAQSIPLCTADRAWVGIGAIGAAIVGTVRDGDPATSLRVACRGLLAIGIVGLTPTGGAHRPTGNGVARPAVTPPR